VCVKTLQRRISQRILQKGIRKVKELRKKRSRPLGTWKFFQVRRKCAGSGGSTVAVRLGGEEIWTIGFYVQEMQGGVHGRNDLNCQILSKNPTAIRSVRSCEGVKPHTKNRSESPERIDTYRDIDTQDIGVLEVEKSGHL
jgi:hypothetical protein